MKNKLVIILAGAFLTIQAFCQNPEIVINQGPVSKTLNLDDSVLVKIPVTNAGNRDLQWTVRKQADPVSFTKEDFADWELSENQDRLTRDLWITRQNSQGIFNLATESIYSGDASPEGTLWSYGKSADLNPGNYSVWGYAIDWNPPEMLNQNMSIYLPAYDDYIDLIFRQWTTSAGGGGFSYERSGLAHWIRVMNKSGVLLPGMTDTIYLYVTASAVTGGTYQGDLMVESNDVTTPVVTIPFTLQANGTPAYSTEDDMLDFGTVMNGDEISLPVVIDNAGTGKLLITGFTGKTGAFSISTLPVEFPGLSRSSLLFSFSPSEAKLYTDTVVITTNDPVSPADTFVLTGSGTAPVVLTLDKTAIEVTVAAGDVDSISLILGNTGIGTLTWELKPTLNIPPVSFSKSNYADWTLAENQDRITPNIWITRADNQGLFNIANEKSFISNTSPSNTLWSSGLTRELGAIDYEVWVDAVNSNPPSLVNNPFSMQLLSEGRYFDMLFHSWTESGNGGGFSYTRTEVPCWLIASEYSGTVNQGTTQEIDVIIDASQVNAGTYLAYLEINSNDPARKNVLLPVTVHITGQPSIAVDPSEEVFGNVFINTTDSLELLITNTGAAVLTVSAISNSLPVFSVNPKVLSIPPKQEKKAMVYFRPVAASAYADTLIISGNDPVTPALKIPLAGIGMLPPVISVSPNALSDTLNFGESSISYLTIKNTGNNLLNWQLYPQIPGSEFTFKKNDWADWNLPQNQDRIADNVWITRTNDMGIFNIASEAVYEGSASPLGTGWVYGYSYEHNVGDYQVWRNAVYNNPPAMVDNVLSMYLPEHNRYFDILFHNWTSGGNGGGFSYTRTEIPKWIFASDYNGTINPGDSVTVDLAFDGTAILGGKHIADIAVLSNDPVNKTLHVPVEILIEGTPEISLTDTIHFGNVFTGEASSMQFAITNSGTDSLRVTGFTTSGTGYSVLPASMVIPAGVTKPAMITLTASTEGLINDTLTLFSNASLHPEMQVIITANAMEKPIRVVPSTLSYILPSDTTIYDTVNVENTGDSDVTFITRSFLDDMLFNLNQHYTYVKKQIPQSYSFAYDAVNFINDGGDDMYDGGNYLYTNLDMIAYSDNVISAGDLRFGAGTRYFSRSLPGLFVVAAELNGISQFYTDGNLGADGSGSCDTTRISYEKMGRVYDGFIKRVYNASDPSVNHMVIVERNSGIVPDYDNNTDRDYHSVDGLAGSDLLIYLLYAGANGEFIDNNAGMNILKAFVDSVMHPEGFADFLTESATITPGNTVPVVISVYTAGLAEGTYHTNIPLSFSQPLSFTHLLPVTLTIEDFKVLKPLSDTVVTEGFGSFDLNLQNYFKSGHPDALSFTAVCIDTSVAVASMNNSLLHIQESGTGNAPITVRVDDNHGHIKFIDFILTVNALPKVAVPLADLLRNEGFGTEVINITGTFTDANNTTLTYTVTSSATNVVTANVAVNSLTITEASPGISTITVQASDSFGAKASDSFTFTVNAVPKIASALPDVSRGEGFGTAAISLTGVFSDANDAVLVYTAVSSATGIVTVNVSGSTLTVTEAGTGSSTITVSATDSHGAKTSDVFTFTVTPGTGVETAGEGIIRLYPNPSNGIVYLDLRNVNNERLLVELTDINGRIMLQQEFFTSGKITLDLQDLSRGVYILKCRSNSINYLERISLLK